MPEQFVIRPSIGFWERLFLLTVIGIGTVAWNNPNPNHDLQFRPTATPTFLPTDIPTLTPTATSTLTASPTPTKKLATPTRKPTLIPKVFIPPTPTAVKGASMDCNITLDSAQKIDAGMLKNTGHIRLKAGETAHCQVENGGQDIIAVPDQGIRLEVKPSPNDPPINTGSRCDRFVSTLISSPADSKCAVVEARQLQTPWDVEITNTTDAVREIAITLIVRSRTYDCSAGFWEDLKGVNTFWTKDCR